MLFAIPQYNPETEEIWEVWAYDLWGNRKDGFEFNNRSSQGALVVPNGADSEVILDCLREQGFITVRYRTSTELEWLDDGMYEIKENRATNEYYGYAVGSVEKYDD